MAFEPALDEVYRDIDTDPAGTDHGDPFAGLACAGQQLFIGHDGCMVDAGNVRYTRCDPGCHDHIVKACKRSGIGAGVELQRHTDMRQPGCGNSAASR